MESRLYLKVKSISQSYYTYKIDLNVCGLETVIRDSTQLEFTYTEQTGTLNIDLSNYPDLLKSTNELCEIVSTNITQTIFKEIIPV